MTRALLVAVLLSPLAAQEAPPLVNSGQPLRVPFACDRERFEEQGHVCLEDEPCVVYTEITAVRAEGSRYLVAGNFHTQSATMASLLLLSEDGGATWTEPYARVKMGSLEQVHFANAETGWISGHIIQSLSRDPFFLVTKDGGKTWRRRPIYSEPTIATLEGFRFDGAQNGEAVLFSEGHSQRWLTRNGGDTWQVSETSERRMTPPPPPEADPAWRSRSDAKLKAHVLERRDGTRFIPVASFLIESARCSAE
jgi:hypothetical protein